MSRLDFKAFGWIRGGGRLLVALLAMRLWLSVRKPDAERLTEILIGLHQGVVIEVTERRGRAPTKYKNFEPYKIERFFESYDSQNKTLFDIAADVVSILLRAHPFPNANHRTMLLVAKGIFEANGFSFPWYEGKKPNWERYYVSDCSHFFWRSKYWLKIRYMRSELRARLKKGKRFMYFQGGGKLVVKEADLDLSDKQVATRHREVTAAWLEQMLGDQSGSSRRIVPDAITRLIAQAER